MKHLLHLYVPLHGIFQPYRWFVLLLCLSDWMLRNWTRPLYFLFFAYLVMKCWFIDFVMKFCVGLRWMPRYYVFFFKKRTMKPVAGFTSVYVSVILLSFHCIRTVGSTVCHLFLLVRCDAWQETKQFNSRKPNNKCLNNWNIHNLEETPEYLFLSDMIKSWFLLFFQYKYIICSQHTLR